MLLNYCISAIFFVFMLGFGQLMMFVEGFVYWLVPLYILLLVISAPFYHETCIAIDWKDFLFSALFVAIASMVYLWRAHTITFDVIAFLYLATFIPYTSYASSIRYKSLM